MSSVNQTCLIPIVVVTWIHNFVTGQSSPNSVIYSFRMMNERQNYSIIHFDMFDKGTVVCVSFASVSHSTKKSKETSTLRSQRHMQVLNKNTYPPTIMAICGRNQSDDLVSSSLEAAVDSWVRQLGGFPEKLIFGNWVGCWFVGGDLIENMCVLFSNLLKYLVLFVEIDFALIIF